MDNLVERGSPQSRICRLLGGADFFPTRQTFAFSEPQPADLMMTPRDALFFASSQPRFGLSAGWIKIVLAALGVVLGVLHRRHRRWVLFLLLTAIVTALLAIGPNLKLGDFQPWWIPAKWIPGISQVRNVFRFVYLTQMAIILLGITGLTELWLRMRACSWCPVTAAVVVHALALLALVESADAVCWFSLNFYVG